MNEKINAGRQKELDYARGLAILFMVAVHCLETFANTHTIDVKAYGIVVEFFGSFTSATVFMILLGVGVIYSRKAESKHLIKRGVLLFAAGYILNIIRGYFPMLISWKLSGSDEWLTYMRSETFLIDIFQFAGLTFIFFGLTKKLKFTPIAYVVALGLFEVFNFLLSQYGFYFTDVLNDNNLNFYLAAFTGLFWGTSELSSFPFLSWIFYPIVGYLFGYFLISQDARGKKRLFTWVSVVSGIIFATTLLLCWYFEIDYGWETDASFYHHLILGNLVFGSCAFLLIGIVYFLAGFIPKFLQKILSRWSTNVTEIYFIQWIIIGWVAIATGYNDYGALITIAITILVFIASDWLAYHFINIKK
jgi:uncharacterized membrane protein